MSTAETVFLIVVGVLILLAFGNWAFSVGAERKNPPIGTFTECEGVRLHYLDRGDPTAPCVVLLHGNGSMIQDFTISGLVSAWALESPALAMPGNGAFPLPQRGSALGPFFSARAGRKEALLGRSRRSHREDR
jgi:hypothetical protein